MRFQPRRSSPRLPAFDYVGGYAYHVSLAAGNHRSHLTSDGLVSFCLDRLTDSAQRYGFKVLAYCFMPDHLHLLVSGAERSDLIRFVQHFKQATGYQHRGLWQRSFYDCVLRREEDAAEIANYIWSNPVVAGLVEDECDYPYSGPRDVIESEARLIVRQAEDRAKALSLRGQAT